MCRYGSLININPSGALLARSKGEKIAFLSIVK